SSVRDVLEFSGCGIEASATHTSAAGAWLAGVWLEELVELVSAAAEPAFAVPPGSLHSAMPGPFVWLTNRKPWRLPIGYFWGFPSRRFGSPRGRSLHSHQQQRDNAAVLATL